MAGSTTAGVAVTVWQQQSVWSQVADALKFRLARWRLVALTLTILAAVLTTVAAQVVELTEPEGRVLAVVAAVAVGLVPVVHSRAGRREVEAWVRARSVSEALKAEMYAFLARVEPYRDERRDGLLSERTALLLADAEDLLRYTAGIEPRERQVPSIQDVETYVAGRLVPQITWYRTKAAALADRLTWARRTEFGLCVLGVILAGIAATTKDATFSAWLPVATTVSAAVTTHITSSRWEYHLIEYLRTATELERLHVMWLSTGGRDRMSADQLVQQAEQVMSAQNEAWMTKWAADNA